MKRELRVLGVDDAPSVHGQRGPVLVVAPLFRGGSFMDGLLSTHVTRDGDDASYRLAEMIERSKFKSQLRAVFLDGIAVAGFNVVDVQALSLRTEVPVIVVMRERPDVEGMKRALLRLSMGHKVALLDRAGPIEPAGSIFIQRVGISRQDAVELLRICTVRGHIPEPVRVAHLIASGVADGESRGRA
ncbi:DUF99 family protein [Candidatus Woesearchaeota archaeon]|nr:MAG: DUF99 family protein [Candidatus Woesearchaeota archaeon]